MDHLDHSEETPMLSFILAMSGLLAAICFFLLLSVRKKVKAFYLDRTGVV